MKIFLKLSFVVLFAVFFACSKPEPVGVTSVADFALSYLLESDTCDSARLAQMKVLRGLDQDMRRSGTGEPKLYYMMASCRCLCSGLCCSCSDSLKFAASNSVSSVRLELGDSVKSSATSDTLGGITIFNLTTSGATGDLELVIDHSGGSLRIPVNVTPQGQIRIP